MRIWCISDTHTLHEQLIVPKNVDMVIHAGDMGESKATDVNANQVTEFLLWLEALSVPHKIVVAGNHDTSVERGRVNPRDFKGIIYLENEAVVETNSSRSLKIWGSPLTPSFGEGWAFNKNRGKIGEYWKEIPPDTDIVVTHGPPMGILDHSFNRDNELEMCGDQSLRKAIMKLNPIAHIFGHIHDCDGCFNAGIRTYGNWRTQYVNASCVTDGKFGQLSHNGQIIEI